MNFLGNHFAQLSRVCLIIDAPLPPVAPEAKVINNAATSTLDNGSKTLPNGSETLPQGSQNATPTTIENNSYTKKNKAPPDKGDFNNWKDYAVEVCPGILRFKLEQLKVPKAYEPLVWEAVEIYAHMGETQLAGIKNPPGYLMSLLTTAAKGQPIGWKPSNSCIRCSSPISPPPNSPPRHPDAGASPSRCTRADITM